MAQVTVTALTAAKMQEIADASITSGRVSGDNLILTTKDGVDVAAGNVRGPQGIQGPVGPAGGAQIAGNLGGTTDVPTVTGALDGTVDASLATVTADYAGTVFTKSLAEFITAMGTISSNLAGLSATVADVNQRKVEKAGETVTLWSGTQAAYDALPTATKTSAGFVAVVRDVV